MAEDMLAAAIIGAGLGLVIYLAWMLPGVVRSVRYDWQHRRAVPEWARRGWFWWLR